MGGWKSLAPALSCLWDLGPVTPSLRASVSSAVNGTCKSYRVIVKVKQGVSVHRAQGVEGTAVVCGGVTGGEAGREEPVWPAHPLPHCHVPPPVLCLLHHHPGRGAHREQRAGSRPAPVSEQR